jgi:ammonium transporter, Amt family
MKALGQLGKQALAMVVVGLYAFAVSYGLATLIERFMGFRVSAEDEVSGVDLSQHAETAYTEGVYGHQQVRRPLFGERDEVRPRANGDEYDPE